MLETEKNNAANSSEGKFDAQKAANAGRAIFNSAMLFMPLIKDVIGEVSNAYQKLDKYKIDRVVDIPYLKGYSKKTGSEIVIAKVGSMLKNQYDSPAVREMSILKDEYVIAEYDRCNERVVQSDFIRKENIADKIMTALNANDDMIIVKEK